MASSKNLLLGECRMLFGDRPLAYDAVGTTPITGGTLNRVPTPEIRELAYGARHLYFGDCPLEFGAPSPLPTQPEKIIVRAAYEIGIPAYAVYQPGGRPVLPSIVFRSTGIVENDTFNRGFDAQDFQIDMRAKRYENVIELSNRYFESLRIVAKTRYNGISGQWSDEYLPSLGYRVRSFSVTLRW